MVIQFLCFSAYINRVLNFISRNRIWRACKWPCNKLHTVAARLWRSICERTASAIRMYMRAKYDAIEGVFLPEPNNIRSKKGPIMSAILAFLNGLFHASAWTSYFPTEFERHLWRAACVIHACAPIILVAAVNFETYEKNLMQTFYFFGYATKPTLRSFFHYAQSVTALDTKLILGRKTSKSKFKKRLINYPHFALMVS